MIGFSYLVIIKELECIPIETKKYNKEPIGEDRVLQSEGNIFFLVEYLESSYKIRGNE
jgi:hypothetical protein